MTTIGGPLGNFYTNFAAPGADPSRVATTLRSLGRSACVAHSAGGTTMAFDEGTEAQDEATIARLGAALSRDLDGPVLACLNHDDDVLRYWLFRGGAVVDEYDSYPGCFSVDGGEAPSGGSAELLADAFGVAAVAGIRSVLHERRFAFAFQRHRALAELLGMDPALATLGYVDIRRGGLPEGLIQQMTHL
jgi:hypothetical protein